MPLSEMRQGLRINGRGDYGGAALRSDGSYGIAFYSGTQKVKIAEMPIRNLDKGSVTTELIAAVLVNKYCDHLPVHRQVERLFKTSGVKPSESSVCRWRDVIAEQLAPLADLMKERIKMSCCINTDATTAPCRLPKEQNRLVHGNQYVYIGNEDEPYRARDGTA
ncbi:hypothetical protein FACS189443_5860 [Planctomycetales bacterium]|nr:hypothetical protein FACS189443_5860 [Planctomycetales bacterium]